MLFLLYWCHQWNRYCCSVSYISSSISWECCVYITSLRSVNYLYFFLFMPHALWLIWTEPGDSVSSYCITLGKESWDIVCWVWFPSVNLYQDVLPLERLKFSPRPVNKKLELGSSARVYCRAQGTLPLIIKWLKVMYIYILLQFHSQNNWK